MLSLSLPKLSFWMKRLIQWKITVILFGFSLEQLKFLSGLASHDNLIRVPHEIQVSLYVTIFTNEKTFSFYFISRKGSVSQ